MTLRKNLLFPILLALSVLVACSPVASTTGQPLVVASTTIVGDVVQQVGGSQIDLRVLLPVDADPHSFSPAPKDVAMVESAALVFLNGFNLEESLADLVKANATGQIVYVSDGISPIEIGDHAHAGGSAHSGDDPHVWLDPRNVQVWVDNIAAALSEMDPDHAADYRANADAYLAELADLHTWLSEQAASIPADQRVLVTDHESLGYFAKAYGFTIVGVIVPGGSTLAEPSAQAIAALEETIQQTGTRAIFVGTTVNTQVAERVAADTGAALVPLYTGSLSAADGPAATYLDLMRYDMGAIVGVLQ
ncbi:MAG: metal ABC transporter substrate-binding protein [Anaerolineales bacterium]